MLKLIYHTKLKTRLQSKTVSGYISLSRLAWYTFLSLIVETSIEPIRCGGAMERHNQWEYITQLLLISERSTSKNNKSLNTA
jgi:hypothetical protein